MLHKAWKSKGEMPYRFPRSSVKFQGHTVQNITDFDPNWAFPDYRPVAAFKSLRFALLNTVYDVFVRFADNLFALNHCNTSLIAVVISCFNTIGLKKYLCHQQIIWSCGSRLLHLLCRWCRWGKAMIPGLTLGERHMWLLIPPMLLCWLWCIVFC